MAGPTVIYGGPYAHESEAIIAEGQKKKPNYEKLISGWNTITQGAVEAIDRAKNPPAPFSGNFVENHKIDKDAPVVIPPTQIYNTPDEDILPQDAEKDRDNPEAFVTVGNIQDQAKPYEEKPDESVKPSDVPSSESIKTGEVKPVDVDLDKL